MKGINTDDVALVELELEVANDVGARRHAGRDEYVGPVLRPSRVVVVDVRHRGITLQPLLIVFFPHYSLSLSLSTHTRERTVIDGHRFGVDIWSMD